MRTRLCTVTGAPDCDVRYLAWPGMIRGDRPRLACVPRLARQILCACLLAATGSDVSSKDPLANLKERFPALKLDSFATFAPRRLRKPITRGQDVLVNHTAETVATVNTKFARCRRASVHVTCRACCVTHGAHGALGVGMHPARCTRRLPSSMKNST